MQLPSTSAQYKFAEDGWSFLAAAAPSNPAWVSHLTSAEVIHLRVVMVHLQEDCGIEEKRKLEQSTFWATVQLYSLQPGNNHPHIT